MKNIYQSDFLFPGVGKIHWVRATLLVFFGGLVISTVGQEEVLRIETSLVTVPVSVPDRDGRSITNLRRVSHF